MAARLHRKHPAVIVSDRELIYAIDLNGTCNHLVAVDLRTSEELIRVANPATLPTIAATPGSNLKIL